MLSITWIGQKVNHKSKWLASCLLALVLCLSITFPAFAVTYGEGTYGSNVYSASDSNAGTNNTSGASGASSSSDSLANTGQNILLIASGAALALGIGGLVILTRRRTRK